MKEIDNSYVIFVTLTLDKKAVLIHMLLWSMKEGNNSNVAFVTTTLDPTKLEEQKKNIREETNGLVLLERLCMEIQGITQKV